MEEDASENLKIFFEKLLSLKYEIRDYLKEEYSEKNEQNDYGFLEKVYEKLENLIKEKE